MIFLAAEKTKEPMLGLNVKEVEVESALLRVVFL